MQVKRLSLSNVRVFEQAEFEFLPGMNLLVGVNGAGKSTVLDVLRFMFDIALLRLTDSAPRNSRQTARFDRGNDISIGQPALTAELQFSLQTGTPTNNAQAEFEKNVVTLSQLVLLQREAHIPNPQAAEGQVRNQTLNLYERDDLTTAEGSRPPKIKGDTVDQPLVVYFSPNRSVLEPSRNPAGAKRETPFVGALEPRGLSVREYAQWWLAQAALAREDSGKKTLLETLNAAICTFLDEYTNFRAERAPDPMLRIDKAGKTLDVRQLSDGERSMIAVVIDLARRLALAYPHETNPLENGRAIVLIDEIDLHLHPGWQRTVCERLERTFPQCQFIATTHSPQIVGEVAADRVQIIDHGQVRRPSQSLGMDTNWILNHLMDVNERTSEAKQELEAVEALIENEEYDQALEKIAELRQTYGEFSNLAEMQAHIEMSTFLDNDLESDRE